MAKASFRRSIWETGLKYRNWVLMASTLVLNSGLTQRLTKGIPCLALNCHACPLAVMACPIGTIQHFVGLQVIPWYILGAISLAGALVGRAACGWLCPFGWIQELVHKIPVPKWSVSPRSRIRWPYAVLVAIAYLGTGGLLWSCLVRSSFWFGIYLLCGFVAYAFLGLSRVFALVGVVVVVPLLTAETWFCKLCPAGGLEGGIPWLLLDGSLIVLVGELFWLKMGIVLALFVWMAVTPRPFCRWICPLGAFWSPFNRASTLHLAVDSDRCIECGKCREVCPVDIAICCDSGSPACIRCLKCLGECPVSCISVELR